MRRASMFVPWNDARKPKVRVSVELQLRDRLQRKYGNVFHLGRKWRHLRGDCGYDMWEFVLSFEVVAEWHAKVADIVRYLKENI